MRFSIRHVPCWTKGSDPRVDMLKVMNMINNIVMCLSVEYNILTN